MKALKFINYFRIAIYKSFPYKARVVSYLPTAYRRTSMNYGTASNCSLYYFVAPQKHSLALELANIWIVVMFLEHFIEHYSFQQQLLFSTWVVAMAAIAVIHAKRCDMFETA